MEKTVPELNQNSKKRACWVPIFVRTNLYRAYIKRLGPIFFKKKHPSEVQEIREIIIFMHKGAVLLLYWVLQDFYLEKDWIVSWLRFRITKNILAPHYDTVGTFFQQTNHPYYPWCDWWVDQGELYSSIMPDAKDWIGNGPGHQQHRPWNQFLTGTVAISGGNIPTCLHTYWVMIPILYLFNWLLYQFLLLA
jgi:hypothetical protein